MKIKNQKHKKLKIFFIIFNFLWIFTLIADSFTSARIPTIIVILGINIYILYSLFFQKPNKHITTNEDSNEKNNDVSNSNNQNLSVDSQKSILTEKAFSEKNARITELDKQIMSREKFIIDTELKYIDNMNGLEFEKYVTDLFNKLGYNAITTKASNDDGVDVIAEKDGLKYAIQCKNYSQPVGNKAVQEVYASKGITQSDVAIVLTNNEFTSSAKKEADILDVQLWNRNKLTNLLYTAFHFDFRNIDDTNKPLANKEFQNGSMYDPLLKEAIECALEMGQISPSFIQRRFKIGYARSGRIIDEMEKLGIVSCYEGSKPRQVIMPRERYNEIKDTIGL